MLHLIDIVSYIFAVWKRFVRTRTKELPYFMNDAFVFHSHVCLDAFNNDTVSEVLLLDHCISNDY